MPGVRKTLFSLIAIAGLSGCAIETTATLFVEQTRPEGVVVRGELEIKGVPK